MLPRRKGGAFRASKTPTRVPGTVKQIFRGAQYPPRYAQPGPEVDGLAGTKTATVVSTGASSSSSSSSAPAAQAGPSSSSRKPSRESKFQALLEADNIDMEALKELSWSGIPDQYRPLCWQLLLGYAPTNLGRRAAVLARKRREYHDGISRYYNTTEQFQDTAFGESKPSRQHGSDSLMTERDMGILHQIQIDIPRTNPAVPLFQQQRAQLLFERILYLWAVRHPASGYVQGINDLVTPFFLVFLRPHVGQGVHVEKVDLGTIGESVLREVEADTHWCMTKFIDAIQDNYTFAQPGIQRMVFSLKEVVHRVDAALYQHLESQHADFLQFSFRWMNCLLIRELKISHVIRLWDTYLAEGVGHGDMATMHVYVCAAFLCKWSKRLQELDFQDLVVTLQHLPTDTWKFSDIEELVAQAYQWKYVFKDAPSHLATL